MSVRLGAEGEVQAQQRKAKWQHCTRMGKKQVHFAVDSAADTGAAVVMAAAAAAAAVVAVAAAVDAAAAAAVAVAAAAVGISAGTVVAVGIAVDGEAVGAVAVAVAVEEPVVGMSAATELELVDVKRKHAECVESMECVGYWRANARVRMRPVP